MFNNFSFIDRALTDFSNLYLSNLYPFVFLFIARILCPFLPRLRIQMLCIVHGERVHAVNVDSLVARDTLLSQISESFLDRSRDDDLKSPSVQAPAKNGELNHIPNCCWSTFPPLLLNHPFHGSLSRFALYVKILKKININALYLNCCYLISYA